MTAEIAAPIDVVVAEQTVPLADTADPVHAANATVPLMTEGADQTVDLGGDQTLPLAMQQSAPLTTPAQQVATIPLTAESPVVTADEATVHLSTASVAVADDGATVPLAAAANAQQAEAAAQPTMPFATTASTAELLRSAG